MVLIGAVVLMAANGPSITGSADQGDNDPDPNGDDTTPTDDTSGDPVTAPQVTTITVTKTAEGFWERTVTYYWSVDKELNSTDAVRGSESDGYDIVVGAGETATITYDLTAERSAPSIVDVFGVRGLITVTNTGCNDTEGLKITDMVMYKACEGDCTEYITFEVDTSCHPVLAAGETYDYPYEITFAPLSAVDYCNVVTANITNYVDHAGECYGVSASGAFVLPNEPEVAVIDGDATLEDVLTVPCGFEVVSLTGYGPWDLTLDDGKDTYVVQVTVEITNVDAAGEIVSLQNSALLVPEDTAVPLVDWYYLDIYGGTVPQAA